MATAQGTFPQVAVKLAGAPRAADAQMPRKVTRMWAAAGLVMLFAAVAIAWYRPLWVLDRFTQTKLAMAGMHGEYVTVDGSRIHFLVGGKGAPVLLVHGLGSRASDWADLIPSIVRSGHRVYAIDLLGYGDSDRPTTSNFSIQQESQIVKDFVVAENLQHFDLAGWSMGGWISMVVATEMPDRVSKLILLDSAGLRFQPSFDPLLFTPTNVQQLGQLVTLLTPNPKGMPDFIAKALLERSQTDAWVVRRAVNSMLTGQNLLDGKLNQLKMPVLIVWGKQDSLTPLSMAYEIHSGVPNSTLQVYDGCGHLAPGLCADKIAPRLNSFLDTSRAPEPQTLDVPAEASTGLWGLLVH